MSEMLNDLKRIAAGINRDKAANPERTALEGVIGDQLAWTPETGPAVRKLAEAILAAGYRKPLTIENEKLVIDDGLLLLDVGSCTCSPYGSSHELGCGYEYLDDLTKPLARAGYRKPRTITTADELDKLRFQAVVLDAYGTPYVCERHATDGTRNEWAPAGMSHLDESETILYHGPVTVIYEGEPQP